MRKAEQGSQQLQGEVQEPELEALLSGTFPQDTIEPVPKREHGGDMLHRVVGPLGQTCGTILWETKRTKNWSDGWLAKLRDDQRAAKAELAVLVSQVLPKEVETFDLIDGVWVTHPRAVVPGKPPKASRPRWKWFTSISRDRASDSASRPSSRRSLPCGRISTGKRRLLQSNGLNGKSKSTGSCRQLLECMAICRASRERRSRKLRVRAYRRKEDCGKQGVAVAYVQDD